MFAGKKPEMAELHDAVSDWTTRHLPSQAGLPDFVGSGSLWASNMLEATYARFFSCSGTTYTGLRTDPVFGPFAETYCDVHDAVSATAEYLAADAADDLLDGLLTSAVSLDKRVVMRPTMPPFSGPPPSIVNHSSPPRGAGEGVPSAVKREVRH